MQPICDHIIRVKLLDHLINVSAVDYWLDIDIMRGAIMVLFLSIFSQVVLSKGREQRRHEAARDLD